MKSYLIPKKYNYFYKYLETNKGISFIKEQQAKLSNFNIELLNNYRDFIISSSDKSIESEVIANDIQLFIEESQKAATYMQKDYYRLSKGYEGEDKVKNILYTYEENWKVLHNATVNINGYVIENDFIVISKGGVSLIEVKNIGTHLDKLKIDELGRLTRFNRYNKEVDSIDVVTQNNRHLAYIKQYLNKIGYTNIPIYSYIVITSNIRIENKSNFKIIGPNQLYEEIKSQENKIDSKEINYIYNCILMDLLEEVKYPYTDYISVLEGNYNIILKSIKEYMDSLS